MAGTGGKMPGAGKPPRLVRAVTERMIAETRYARRLLTREALETLSAQFAALARECVEPLRARVREGDVAAIRTALQYGMLTYKEQADLARSDALERLAEFTGIGREALLSGGVSDLVVRAGGVLAYAGMLALAESGDYQAMRYMCDRYLGEPAQSVTMRSAHASQEEIRELLMREYLSQGHTEAEARRLVELAEAAAEQAALDDRASEEEAAADGANPAIFEPFVRSEQASAVAEQASAQEEC